MSVTQWRGEEFERDVLQASRAGLRSATLQFVTFVKQRLSRIGTPSSLTGARGLERGQRALARRAAGELTGRVSRNEQTAARVQAAGGLVDPAGGSPRLRTGTLRRSIISEPDDRAGQIAYIAGASVKYGAIHEFGGTVNTKSSPWLVFQVAPGIWRKAKSVFIPARPYLRPTLREKQQDLFRAFVDGAKAYLESKR